MKNNRIRLTESQLNRVIKESVKRALRESYFPRPQNGISSDLAERINIARDKLYELRKDALYELQDDNNKYLQAITQAFTIINNISNSMCTDTDY